MDTFLWTVKSGHTCDAMLREQVDAWMAEEAWEARRRGRLALGTLQHVQRVQSCEHGLSTSSSSTSSTDRMAVPAHLDLRIVAAARPANVFERLSVSDTSRLRSAVTTDVHEFIFLQNEQRAISIAIASDAARRMAGEQPMTHHVCPQHK